MPGGDLCQVGSGRRCASPGNRAKVHLPILAENGIELAGPPEVIEVHNIVKR